AAPGPAEAHPRRTGAPQTGHRTRGGGGGGRGGGGGGAEGGGGGGEGGGGGGGGIYCAHRCRRYCRPRLD
ncbi:hypothetical protein I7P85_09975, partial [Neisseria meningitidis]|nr:hypothetical protein [Neisseria meningitidis]